MKQDFSRDFNSNQYQTLFHPNIMLAWLVELIKETDSISDYSGSDSSPNQFKLMTFEKKAGFGLLASTIEQNFPPRILRPFKLQKKLNLT